MRKLSVAFLILGISMLVTPALAAHGKAGLWQITATMNMPGMAAQIPPAQLAQMRAHGIKIPTNTTITTTHCMTAQEVAMDKPPPMDKGRAKDCKMQNLKTDGQSVSADMVCSGADMSGTGHFALTYDTPEHYAGKMTMDMTTRGHRVAMTNSFEARWISPVCKAK